MRTPLFHREAYLRKLRPFYRSDLIKVITGIRRCGKSCLLLSVMEELRRDGVSGEAIVYLNLDKRGFRNIRRPDQLEAAIDARMPTNAEQVYLFVDEIQNVEDFEPVLNAYREEGNVSIFATGSNSYLFGGELATKLTGRYVEFDIFPLSFREWLEMRTFLGSPAFPDRNAAFMEYIRFGGFPKTLEFDEPAAREAYVESVVSQILQKDVRRRFKIHSRPVFDKVRTYLVNNFGAPVSLHNLEDEFRRQGIPVSQRTLRRYLEVLEKARILYPCPRFDLKSRKSLRGGEKCYLADTGVYFAGNADGRINYGPVLENLVFVHLKSEGFRVSVGRIGDLECDFIARRGTEYYYIQVAMTIASRETEEREYASFGKIRDNYPKYLFTLDPLLQNRDGIRHCNLLDFLDGRVQLQP